MGVYDRADGWDSCGWCQCDGELKWSTHISFFIMKILEIIRIMELNY
jgi:hypothetical protein